MTCQIDFQPGRYLLWEGYLPTCSQAKKLGDSLHVALYLREVSAENRRAVVCQSVAAGVVVNGLVQAEVPIAIRVHLIIVRAIVAVHRTLHTDSKGNIEHHQTL